MARRLLIILVGLFFALMFLTVGVNAYRIWALMRHDDGWTSEVRNNRVVIVDVRDDGPAAGVLHEGDEIVAMAGRPVKVGGSQIDQALRSISPGTPYTMTVRRSGQESRESGVGGNDEAREAGALQEVALRTNPAPFSRILARFATMSAMIFSFLFAGFIIFLLKPYDKQALLLALIFGMFVAFPDGYKTGTVGLPAWLVLLMQAPVAASYIFFAPVFLHFFLVFPEAERPLSPLIRRFPRIERYIYFPILFLLLPLSALVTLLMTFLPEQRAAIGQKIPWLAALGGLISLVYGVGGLVSLLVNYWQADELSRRRMRIVVVGSLVGLLPLMLFVILNGFGFNYRNSSFMRWFDFLLVFTLPLMPLAFTYAIIRHKVIPISFIIRRSVRYLLVSRGSIVLQIIFISLAMTFFMTALFNYLRPRSGIVIGVVSAAVAILVWNLSAALNQRVIGPAIDRRFFREAYDAQQILSELGQAVRTVTSVEQLLELVVIKIQRALQTENVTVFLRDDASTDFVCALSYEYQEGTNTGVASRPSFVLPRDSFVVEWLSKSSQPLKVDFTDPDSWLQGMAWAARTGEGGSRRREQEILESIHSALLLPLYAKDRMLGLVSLGPRLGDLPFSSEDERLLVNVAGQMTFALENAQLVERMIVEERRRREIEAENEQRAKELEEARQLQLSMLPKTVPQLPNLDIAAYMKTATEVGGDYYDFHLADDGTLTVAVGDATGHGLKAGTMVTAAKSLFKTLAHEPDIVKVFLQSSRVLKDMNLRSLYMAMLMIKVKDNQIKVSVAGMPPMLIYRAGARRVEEVSLRGMPLGSVKFYPYQQQELSLAAGDTVVLMSDGFPERFNEQGEMMDYAQAKTLLEEVAHQSPQDIINHFVQKGEAWAGNRPQDDDVTFVVLKVKERV